jgi:hypothetical protein
MYLVWGICTPYTKRRATTINTPCTRHHLPLKKENVISKGMLKTNIVTHVIVSKIVKWFIIRVTMSESNVKQDPNKKIEGNVLRREMPYLFVIAKGITMLTKKSNPVCDTVNAIGIIDKPSASKRILLG